MNNPTYTKKNTKYGITSDGTLYLRFHYDDDAAIVYDCSVEDFAHECQLADEEYNILTHQDA